VLQVTLSESGGPISACFLLSVLIARVLVTWLRYDAFGSQMGDWSGLATAGLLLFALCIVLLKLIFWLLTRERDANESQDEGEKEYWRIHGG